MSYRCLRFLNMSSLSDASKSLDPVKLQQVPAGQHHPLTLFARESGPEFHGVLPKSPAGQNSCFAEVCDARTAEPLGKQSSSLSPGKDL